MFNSKYTHELHSPCVAFKINRQRVIFFWGYRGLSEKVSLFLQLELGCVNRTETPLLIFYEQYIMF